MAQVVVHFRLVTEQILDLAENYEFHLTDWADAHASKWYYYKIHFLESLSSTVKLTLDSIPQISIKSLFSSFIRFKDFIFSHLSFCKTKFNRINYKICTISLLWSKQNSGFCKNMPFNLLSWQIESKIPWPHTYTWVGCEIKISFVVDYGWAHTNIFKWMNETQRVGHCKWCTVVHCGKLWFSVALCIVSVCSIFQNSSDQKPQQKPNKERIRSVFGKLSDPIWPKVIWAWLRWEIITRMTVEN